MSIRNREDRKIKRALVTGAGGFIASWVVKGLLDMGVEVHGTVRSLANDEKTAHLSQLAKERPDRLKLFEADLLEEGSFRKAAAGCDTVFHLASPFVPFKVKDPQAELIDPAVRGDGQCARGSFCNTVGKPGCAHLERGRGHGRQCGLAGG